MRRITRRLVVVAVAVILVAGTAVAASAAARHFGYHRVREGLPSGIRHFSLTSTDIREGRPIPHQFWGCTGPGVSPELAWSGAPAAARSYAITVFDPDAPTGSGFWHWIAWDIPAGTTSLPTGAVLPSGAVNGTNDAGRIGYTGPCPPVGDITHHYKFTVVALDVPSLQLPADTRRRRGPSHGRACHRLSIVDGHGASVAGVVTAGPQPHRPTQRFAPSQAWLA